MGPNPDTVLVARSVRQRPETPTYATAKSRTNKPIHVQVLLVVLPFGNMIGSGHTIVDAIDLCVLNFVYAHLIADRCHS